MLGDVLGNVHCVTVEGELEGCTLGIFRELITGNAMDDALREVEGNALSKVEGDLESCVLGL